MAFTSTSIDDYKNDIKPDQNAAPLSDSLSSISWSQTLNNIFAATLWDGSLKIYEVSQTQFGPAILQRLQYKFPSPALKCCWNNESTNVYVGLADGMIKAFDLNSSNVADIGKQQAPISSLHTIPGQNAFISTGYENTANFWQIGNPNPAFQVNFQNKVFTADFQFPFLITGLANEKIGILDMNLMNNKSIVESADLGKFSQIQSIAINQKCTTFGIASFDGRANISTLQKGVNGQYTQKSIITFKSNKQEEGGNTYLFPINSVGFNPVNQKWFMTAGSDGGMHFWDFEAKNKIKTLNYGGMPITTAKVSAKGDMIAYGLGNDWHLGQQGSKFLPKIGVHLVTEQETIFKK